MKVIITGASGMVGKGVLMECLQHPAITDVLSIGRRKLGLDHDKLIELVHRDFAEFASIADQLEDYDACYHCMGVSAANMDEKKYTVITMGYTLALATQLFAIKPNMVFIYVSGAGTDSTAQGRSMWARVKGETENELLQIGFRQAYMFRPGAIIPLNGIQASSKFYRNMIRYFKWLILATKWVAPHSVVNTTEIGLAMIHITQHGYVQNILRPKDILIAAKEAW